MNIYTYTQGLWTQADAALVMAVESAEKIQDLSGWGLSLSVLSWLRYVHGKDLRLSLTHARAVHALGVFMSVFVFVFVPMPV